MPPWMRLTGIAAIIAAAGGIVLLYPVYFPVIFAVNSLMPTSGVVGTDIAIAGAGFDPTYPVALNQTVVPSRFLGPSEILIDIPQVDPGQYTVSVNGVGNLPLTVVAGSLTVSPDPFAATIGQTSPLTVTLPAAAPTGGVSLNIAATPPPPALVRIASVPPISAPNVSLSVGISGVAVGPGTLRVSGTGFTPYTLPFTSMPPPSFSLTLAGFGQAFHFGDLASSTVTLIPMNGFSDTVALSTSGQPSLTSGGWSFSPSPSIDASGSSLSRTLHGVVTPSLFSPGSNVVNVRGISQSSAIVHSAASSVVVAHAQGDFTHIYPMPQVPAATSTDCADGTTNVHINFASFGMNAFRTTFTRTDLPGMPASGQTTSVFYLVSPHCRIGITLNGVGLQQLVSLFNLGFTGVPGWDITRPPPTLPTNALRQQYWFSQDDTLLVAIRIIGQTPDSQLPPGTVPGTIWTYAAALIDPLTGSMIRSEQQFNSLNLAADIKEMQNMQFNMGQNPGFLDPDPDPNAGATPIADIFKIELVRDPSGTLQAEGTFRILNGQPDGTTFEQESATHPNHFGKFDLAVP